MKTNSMAVLLGLMVLLSAVGVIRAKHENRKLFVQLQALEKERDQMNVEWGQLQLEQGTWATSSRVEEIARKRLGMEIPKSESVIIIRP
jgi:cell division protein FtsL